MQSQSVLVLGGTSGMGLAIAQAAQAQGAARVVVAGRSATHSQAAMAVLGPGAEVATLDVTDDEALRDLMARIGPVDHLVFTAGDFRSAPMRAQSLKDASYGMDIKFWGAWKAVRYAGIRSGGSVLLFSGSASRRPRAGGVIMAATNAAVEGLGRALAIELAPIRVNVLAPGFVPDTGVYAAMSVEDREAMTGQVVKELPARRAGASADIAQAALALMTNPYITGIVLDVDGGGTIA